jgi:hypothetical protein
MDSCRFFIECKDTEKKEGGREIEAGGRKNGNNLEGIVKNKIVFVVL